MSTGRFKTLTQTFDLPDLADDETGTVHTPSNDEVMTALSQAKDLEKQFNKMDHYDTHDKEMDELSALAIQAHKDLQDLGMNVEIRHAGEIFSSSSQMLKIAVDAKNNKVEKKLKLLKLQLDKMKIDIASKKEGDSVDGTAVRLDRNELLKQLRQIPDDDK